MRALCIASCLSLFVFHVNTQSTTQNRNILPYTIIPLSYDVKIKPNFEKGSDFTFDGDLTLDFKPVKHYVFCSVVVHMENISVISVAVSSFDDNSSRAEDIVSAEYDPDSQWYNVTVSEPFTVDKVYRLTIKYSGVITGDRRGLYRSSYVDQEGITQWYIVTQLRPIYARRLLPCLDEPRYKATFKLSVWTLPQYDAISNMPVECISDIDQSTGKKLVSFKQTLRMSPFLLALAVFKFASLKSNNHMFATWTVPSQIRSADWAQQMVPHVVNAMEQLTMSKFPLPKMDQVALPDLEPVAMENWGMNTYREGNILYTPGKSPAMQITNVPRFTGHEVSHYWIGNSVTIAWWDWLWMSEAFAMYLEYYLPNQVDPSWYMLHQVIIDLVQPGLLADSIPSSVPLTTHVETRSEIVGKFSGLAYTKGPALIRMVEHILTSDKFKEAFRKLLRTKAFGIVTPKEFWSFFDTEAATQGLLESITNIMTTWTDKPGYPLLTVTRDYKTSTIRVTQERFLQDRPDTGTTSTLWWVPLTYTSKSFKNFNDTRTKVWLSNKCNTEEIQQNIPKNDWIIFNLQLTGFYRVNYDPTNWKLLIHQLKSDKTSIHVLNRAQLIDDSLQLARARRLSYIVVFDLLTYLKTETNYIPWSSAFNGLDFLEKRLTGYAILPKFMTFVKNIVTPLYQQLGYEESDSDNHLEKLLRLPAVTWACSHGVRGCRNIAAQKVKSLMSGNAIFRVTPGLEAITLCTAVEKGGKAEWDFVQNITSVTGASDALACSSDQRVISSYLLNSIKMDSESKWSEKFASVISRPSNINTAFCLLMDNIETLRMRFGIENVKNCLTQIGDLLTTDEQKQKLQQKLRECPEGIQNVLTAVIKALDTRLVWLTQVYPTIEQWLIKYTK